MSYKGIKLFTILNMHILKKNVLLLLCFLSLASAALSHTNKPAKLKSQWHPTGNHELDSLADGYFYYRGNDTAILNKLCLQLARISQNSSKPVVIGFAGVLAGKLYTLMGAYDTSLPMLQKAIRVLRPLQDSLGREALASALITYAAICAQQGDAEPALSSYLDAANIYRCLNNKERLIPVYSSLGDLYDKLLKSEKRRYYNILAYNLTSQTSDAAAQCRGFIAMANNLANDNQYGNAQKLYMLALARARRSADSSLIHTVLYDLGFMNSHAGNYRQALYYYTQAYDIAVKAGLATDAADALYKMGLSLYYLNEPDQSRQVLAKAWKLAEELNSDILRRNILDVLYSLEETAGNYKKAYEYLNQYVDVVYSIFDAEDQKQVNYLNARFEASDREHRIASLNAEKEIRELKLHKQRIWIIVLLIILASLTFIGFLIIRTISYKRKVAAKIAELQEQELLSMKQERELIATRSVLEGEEAERSRLARDLHDGLGGLLSGLKLNLSTMKGNSIMTAENEEAFRQALHLLDTSIHELRRVAHNLMPETLSHYGLRLALSDFVAEFRQSGAGVHFDFFGSELRYQNQLELTAFRIAQELVNNAVKHAQATRIDVQLMLEVSRISIQVYDNGKGFDPSQVSLTGKGLLSIKERVEAFGGNFNIDSKPGSGTEATLEFLVS